MRARSQNPPKVPDRSRPSNSITLASDRIAAYYERKTEAILERYGPGPRVHFHTGFTEEPDPRSTAEVLRSQLFVAQERMLEYAAEAWQLRSIPFREVLDVGCGLGGGAIFWAKQFGARVTAVTIAPSHIELVRRFAAQAAVESLVVPLLSDAVTVPGTSCFDAAIAIDSSSSFPRRPWFRRLARLLRPGGHVLIFDCFMGSRKYEEEFNRHWCAQIGTVNEYVLAATESRFVVRKMEDVSTRAMHFWTTTSALIQAEIRDRMPGREPRAKLVESLRIHSLVRRGLHDGGLRHMLMSFTKP